MDSRLRFWAMAIGGALAFATIFFVVWNNRSRLSGSRAVESPAVEAEVAEEAPQTGSGQGQIGGDLSAFLLDKDFFDQQVSDGDGAQFAIRVSSLDSDLRVFLVDALGSTMSGLSFAVEVEGLGRFTDTDGDGYLRIQPVDPGQRQIRLVQAGEQALQGAYQRILVPKEIQALPWADISRLSTEPEATRDVAPFWGLEDGAGAQSFQPGDGIIISAHTQALDWEALSQAGVKLALIRLAFRDGDGRLARDGRWGAWLAQAKSHGVEVGFYVQSQAKDGGEAVEEASLANQLLAGEAQDAPVFYLYPGDISQSRQRDLTKEQRTALAQLFCQVLATAGKQGGVFATQETLGDYVFATWLEEYPVAVSHFSKALELGQYAYWHYRLLGKVDGAEGGVSLVRPLEILE